MGSGPRLLIDDPQLRRSDGDPVRRRARGLMVLAPLVPLFGEVPADHASIEVPEQSLTHRRRRPALQPPLLRPRRWSARRVEPFRNGLHAVAVYRQREDLPDDPCLGLIDSALDMRALPI